ncbi:MAG: hypothetical protein RLZZ15_4378 [Verrucomicrobiota bacterium]
MSRFVISCGGTGGHLSPGISLAEGLAARGHDAVLCVSRKKVDERLLQKYPQFRFERMPGTGFAWRPADLARFVISQAQALGFCLRLLRAERPAGIVGFGGFTSAPLVIAGRLLRVPVALHESNRVPGRAIRTLGRFAHRVYLPPAISLASVAGAATRHVGLPVRREITRQPQAAARAALGLDPQQKLLVVLGGSQGSGALNDWVRTQLPALAAEGVQVYCVTGLGKGRDGATVLQSKTGAPVRCEFVAFTDRVADLLSAADLVLSRAGAGTLAELIRCGTPAILVPYPEAADDHQRANAAYLDEQRAALAVDQKWLSVLHREVLGLIGDDARLREFRTNLRRLDRDDALETILRDLESLVGGARPPATATAPATG